MKHLQDTYRGQRIAHGLHLTATALVFLLMWTNAKTHPYWAALFALVAFFLALTSGRAEYTLPVRSETPIDDAVRRDLHIKDAE